MDIDRKSYIFGSFSRRRQSQDVLSVKRRSILSSSSINTIIHKPQLEKTTNTTSSSSSVSSPSKSKMTKFNLPKNDLKHSSDHHLQQLQQQNDWKLDTVCDICQRRYVDPRVLPCLHTFCAHCLSSIVISEYTWSKDCDESSSGSGYGSEKRDASSSTTTGTWSPKANSSNHSNHSNHSKRSHSFNPDELTSIIICPSCKFQHTLPPGGISSLPSNYIIQNRLKEYTYDKDFIQVLCDLCAYDVPASGFCKTCEKNMCPLCWDSHIRQRETNGHEITNLKKLTRNKTKTHSKCTSHPDYLLTMYCMSCMQVICQKCCIEQHQGHSCELIEHLTRLYTKSIQEALQRARPATEQALNSLEQVRMLSRKIETRSNIVQKEVEGFIEIYKQSIDEHRQTLLSQIRKSKEDKLKIVNCQQLTLERRIEEANQTIKFAEELLTEGSGVELLAFVNQVLKKLEWCSEIGRPLEPRVSDCIQFLPNEQVPATVNKTPLYGMITTQTVSPQNCFLIAEDLQNIRVHRKTELIIEARDIDNRPLCHGGEKIVVELRFKDSASRTVPVNITDHRDGTYTLTFIPDAAGHLILSVLIKGKHIKGSPFSLVVRTVRPHHGIFHCCSFCSSGGSKHATCGCGGTMPGGYKGCGHGHEGHPGRRHWSCCGSIFEHSECNTIGSSHYQFTL